MGTRLLTADVPAPLADAVERLAARWERPSSAVIQQALETHVDLEEHRDCLTREALASVDADRLIDDEDVTAWIDSLGTEQELPPPA